jgi:hypothetical protein
MRLRYSLILCEISSSRGGEYDVRNCLLDVLPCKMIVILALLLHIVTKSLIIAIYQVVKSFIEKCVLGT